jgi:hypothetical protein
MDIDPLMGISNVGRGIIERGIQGQSIRERATPIIVQAQSM